MALKELEVNVGDRVLVEIPDIDLRLLQSHLFTSPIV